MSRKIIVELSRSEKRQLRIWIQREAEAGLRTRMSIILHLARGRPAVETADAMHVARSTVYRVAERFGLWGFAGLGDRREDNGPAGVGDILLASSPCRELHAGRIWLCSSHVDAGVVVSGDGTGRRRSRFADDDESLLAIDRCPSRTATAGAALPVVEKQAKKPFATHSQVDRIAAQE